MSAREATSDRYAMLGNPSEDGLIVRFEPGFGLNVYVEHHWRDRDGALRLGELLGMSIQGWERICEYVDEWRRRNEVE